MADAKKVPRRRAKLKKPTERAILAVARKLVDPDTGEEVKAFVPAYPMDRRAMNEAKVRLNDMVLIDVHLDRNPRFWRLFHAMGGWLADNTDDLAGLSAHDALKAMQLNSRVWCELADFVLEDGTTVRHWTTKSLSFASAGEDVAQEVWTRMCDHVAEKYLPDMTPEQVAEVVAFWERDQ